MNLAPGHRGCAVRTIPLLFVMLVGSGCGVFGADDASPRGESESSDADRRFCELFAGTIEGFGRPSVESLLTGTDRELIGPMGSMASIAANRLDEVGGLGRYELGVRAIERRGLRAIRSVSKTNPTPRPPRMRVSTDELASVRSADALLSAGACVEGS